MSHNSSGNERPTHLDLFSGIGGFSLAFEAAGFKTIGFSEIEPYACKVLKRHWPEVQNFGDIKNVTRKALADAIGVRKSQSEGSESNQRRRIGYGGEQTGRGYGRLADVITGGFPCQPFSFAGKRRGSADDRALWPEMLKVIAEVRPSWVVGENVPGIISMELDRVLSDLENIGYSAWPIVVPACAVDAKHRRSRVWIVGHSHEVRRGTFRSNQDQRRAANGAVSTSQQSTSLADANEPRSQGRHGSELREREPERLIGACGSYVTDAECKHGNDAGHGAGQILGQRFSPSGLWNYPAIWQPEPELGRVANGIPNRSHRLKGLGNAIVPQVAQIFAHYIRQLI